MHLHEPFVETRVENWSTSLVDWILTPKKKTRLSWSGSMRILLFVANFVAMFGLGFAVGRYLW